MSSTASLLILIVGLALIYFGASRFHLVPDLTKVAAGTTP